MSSRPYQGTGFFIAKTSSVPMALFGRGYSRLSVRLGLVETKIEHSTAGRPS